MRAVARRDGAASLLGRVRHHFALLLALLLVVEGVEWFDAGTALFPDRTVAALGMAVALAWGVALRHGGRVPDAHGRFARAVLAVAPMLAIVLVGWGLGRPGATLALLLGAALLRASFGSRRAVLLATAGLIAAYTTVGMLHDGVVATLTDLGLVTVAVALASFAWVIRLVAEVMARHDVVATWDDVLSGAGHALLGVTDHRQVAPVIDHALDELRRRTPAATGGLLPAPAVPRVSVEEPLALDASLPVELWDRLDRLRTDARLVTDLLESQDRYRNLAEHSRDGIYVRGLDEPGRVLYANGAAHRLGGAAVAPGAAPLDLELVHEQDHALLVEAVADHGYLAEPVTLRLLDETQEDGHRWIQVVETPSTHAGGVVTAVQGTVRDVSVAQRQELALELALEQEQRATDRMRHVDELRTTFLAAVSHELRTPLAGLLGASQTLVAHRQRLSEEQSTALLGAVNRQAARLQGLLDDLLDVERLSRGLLEPERQVTALMPLVYRVVGTFEGATTRVSIAGDDGVVVDVDPAQVERIVDNLLRNALKHTAETVEVRVLVEAHPHGAIVVVEDDGPGVPPALRDGLFSPFVQGPQARTHHSPGTGIGLSLVRKFAELHGGRAWVEESVSGGARFVVLLTEEPVVATVPAPAPTRSAG